MALIDDTREQIAAFAQTSLESLDRRVQATEDESWARLDQSASKCAAAALESIKLAKEGGPGQVIATILCDSGSRYLSRLFNPEWLEQKGLTPKAKRLEFLERL